MASATPRRPRASFHNRLLPKPAASVSAPQAARLMLTNKTAAGSIQSDELAVSQRPFIGWLYNQAAPGAASPRSMSPRHLMSRLSTR